MSIMRFRAVTALLVMFVVFAGAFTMMYRGAAAGTGDCVPYVLDDAYIHMAIAKNLARHGVWGVHDAGFTSTSSSPLWTLLLAGAYSVSGVNDITALVLNIVFAAALMMLLYFALRGWSYSPASATAVTLSILLLSSTVPLIFAGMEHIMHALLAVAFVLVAVRSLTGSEKHDIGVVCALGAVTVLFVATRYESLFMVAMFFIIALILRRWAPALAAAAGAAVPVLTYGLISVMYGSYLLPNTLLLKGTRPSGVLDLVRILTVDAAFGLGRAPHMAVLLGVVLLVGYLNYRTSAKLWSAETTMVALVIGSAILQLQFGATSLWESGFCRYDAYLMTVGLLALLVNFRKIQRTGEKMPVYPESLLQWITAGLALLFLFAPLIGRAYRSVEHVSPAARNIYEQQVQMGKFLDRYYSGSTVGANDIGAINYFADIRCVDFVGLGTYEVVSSKMAGTYGPEEVKAIAEKSDMEIAVAYKHWIPDVDGWITVGEWEISNNIVCGGEVVTFYACRPSAVDKLVSSLRAFQPFLPAGVEAELFVTEP